MKRFLICMVAILSLIGFASAIDMPPMREGFWSIRTQTISNPGNVKTDFTQKICRNHAYDDSVRAKARNRPGCKVLNENLSGHTYTVEMECNIGGSVVHTKGVTTGTEGEASHSETHTTYSPALNGVSDTMMIMDQKYLGSCPSGTEPGDIIRADGTVLHTGKR